MNRDKTRLRDFSDMELDAFGECAQSLLVEAELKIRYARWNLARIEEELEFRKSGKSRRPEEEWVQLWRKETEDVATACGVSLGYVAEIALRLSKEL